MWLILIISVVDQNIVADSLSRMPTDECTAVTRQQTRNEQLLKDPGQSAHRERERERVGVPEREREGEKENDSEGCRVPTYEPPERVLMVGWNEHQLIQGQEAEPWIKLIRDFVKGLSTEFPSDIKIARSRFKIENNILYVVQEKSFDRDIYRVVIPNNLIKKALNDVHSSELAGHMGIDRTYLRARDHFFWKGMKEDVKMYVNNCHECMENKSHIRKEPLGKFGQLYLIFF